MNISNNPLNYIDASDFKIQDSIEIYTAYA